MQNGLRSTPKKNSSGEAQTAPPLRDSNNFTSIRKRISRHPGQDTRLRKRPKPDIPGTYTLQPQFQAPNTDRPSPTFKCMIGSEVTDVFFKSCQMYIGIPHRVVKVTTLNYRESTSSSLVLFRAKDGIEDLTFGIWQMDLILFKNAAKKALFSLRAMRDSKTRTNMSPQLCAYEAEYRLETYGNIEIELKENSLVFSVKNMEPVELPYSDLIVEMDTGTVVSYSCLNSAWKFKTSSYVREKIGKAIGLSRKGAKATPAKLLSNRMQRTANLPPASPQVDLSSPISHSKVGRTVPVRASSPPSSDILGAKWSPIGGNPLGSDRSPNRLQFSVPSSPVKSGAENLLVNVPNIDDEDLALYGKRYFATTFFNRIANSRSKLNLKPSQRAPRKRVTLSVDLIDVREPRAQDIEVLKAERFHNFKYTFWDNRSMTIHLEDIARLNDNVYLNDTLIWFFMKLALERCVVSKAQWYNDVVMLDTFFYSTVRTGRIPKWVLRLDILKKQVVFIPINENNHWSLAVVSGLNELASDLKEFGSSEVKPKLLILDSLGAGSVRTTSRKVVNVIKNVFELHELPPIAAKNFTNIKTDNPCQDNMTDCGVYLLHYINVIMPNLDMFLSAVERFEGTYLELGDFWKNNDVSAYRSSMKSTLRVMSEKYQIEETNNDDEIGLEDDDFMEIVETSRTPKSKSTNKKKAHKDEAQNQDQDKSSQPDIQDVEPSQGSQQEAEESGETKREGTQDDAKSTTDLKNRDPSIEELQEIPETPEGSQEPQGTQPQQQPEDLDKSKPEKSKNSSGSGHSDTLESIEFVDKPESQSERQPEPQSESDSKATDGVNGEANQSAGSHSQHASESKKQVQSPKSQSSPETHEINVSEDEHSPSADSGNSPKDSKESAEAEDLSKDPDDPEGPEKPGKPGKAEEPAEPEVSAKPEKPEEPAKGASGTAEDLVGTLSPHTSHPTSPKKSTPKASSSPKQSPQKPTPTSEPVFTSDYSHHLEKYQYTFSHPNPPKSTPSDYEVFKRSHAKKPAKSNPKHDWPASDEVNLL